ncbi:methyltransferase domain-containing protein [Neobacillus cucumis]|uniref:class I SAM-dependent methyltransferase n=1 Tax=Neobacillus cucumis TaxID=1740721 RepID=UPI0018DF5A78|nr:methyltransferase domain-containing protein [Neobacillus cucumis]MBI0578929.1 methyltransferase domain-containing protein [Neobacillus cucumis]
MNNEIIEKIVGCMASNVGMSDIQKIQTNHRIKLAEFWKIEDGKKILEVGCGQGDTTAVLAHFVGENGLVHGIDIGSPDYGSPISLGESATYLKKSPLGKQIKIDFEIDLLSPNVDFPDHSFDYIVFSHCSWYLKSHEELTEVLKKVKKWGKRLLFAEWDTRITEMEQYPHLLSILIQAQYEAYKTESDSNVRTLFTPNDLREIAQNAGWNIIRDTTIISPELQDGTWEVQKVLSDVNAELKEIHPMPMKIKSLIPSEVKMLEDAIQSKGIKPLSVHAFIAK